MYRWLLALSSAAIVAASASAQAAGGASNTGDAGTIDPGMTRAQVIERLGKPATIRNYQGSTYLLYSNKCGKACGMQDLVILDHDVVVDAVFRSPNRHYTGTSSSPEATKANSRTQRNQPLAVPAQSAGKAEVVAPSMRHVPADSASSALSHPPMDSARTPTSRPPMDSARSSMSHPPADSSMAPPPQNTNAPYGKRPTAAPPADSAASATSHAPADSSATSTSHPPKPPK